MSDWIQSLVPEQEKYLRQRVEKSMEYLQSLYGSSQSSTRKESGQVSNLEKWNHNHDDHNHTTQEDILTKRNEHLRRWLFIFVKKNGTVSYNMVHSQAKKDCYHLIGSTQKDPIQLKPILDQLLNEMCIEIRGCFVLKQLNNPSVDKYRSKLLHTSNIE